MAKEKENVEAASQTEEQPNSRFSEGQETQSSAQAPESFEEFRKRYGSDLDDYLDRKFQSFKDTRLGTHETDIDKLKREQSSIRQTLAELEKYKKEGLTEAQAVREMERDAEIREIKQQVSKPPTSVGTESEQTWFEREQTILKSANVDDNDQRFIEFIRENKDLSPQEYIDKLETQSLQWRNTDLTKPKPSPSTVASTTKGSSQARRQYDDLEDGQISDKIEELSKDYTKNKSEIDELVAELERRDTTTE